MCFNDDGTQIYLGAMSTYPDGYVRMRPLSSAWDISTIGTLYGDFLWVSGYPKSIRFSDGGDYMYIQSVYTSSPYSSVLEYTLTSPYTIGGASNTASTSMESYDTDSYGVCFYSGGGTMLVMGNNTGTIYYWTLPTAWRLVGESKTDELDIDALIGGTQRDIFCNSDGSKIYVMSGDGYLYQFDI